MIADLSQECGTPSHNNWMIFLGIPSILLYVIGIPLLPIIFRLYHVVTYGKSTMHLEKVNLNMKSQFWFWDIVVSFRKIVLIAVVVFSNNNVSQQLLWSQWVFVMALLLHALFQPYSSSLLNAIEGTSLLA